MAPDFPILDPGSPVSFGGYNTAKRFASYFGITFEPMGLENPTKIGFGPNGHGGGRAGLVWMLPAKDLNERDVHFRFELIENDDSPLIIGLDFDAQASYEGVPRSI